MAWRIFLFIPCAIFGALLVQSLKSGRALDWLPGLGVPGRIVDRRDLPREYWSAMFGYALAFAALLHAAIFFS